MPPFKRLKQGRESSAFKMLFAPIFRRMSHPTTSYGLSLSVNYLLQRSTPQEYDPERFMILLFVSA